ncbi:MAG: cytochrome c [Gammaproteobacteria bacterium]|nr:cytochrome c [Gammaproteobacteria bacterium]
MKKYLLATVTGMLVLVFQSYSNEVTAAQPDMPANPANTTQVQQGKKIYGRFCALCHGRNLEGQANWRIRKPDGKLPAPPHDETGHTWHHPDQVLFDITKFGLVPPNAPENYQTDMPAWKETLSDADIWAVLAYIKSRWPPESLRIQREVNAKAKAASASNN